MQVIDVGFSLELLDHNSNHLGTDLLEKCLKVRTDLVAFQIAGKQALFGNSAQVAKLQVMAVREASLLCLLTQRLAFLAKLAATRMLPLACCHLRESACRLHF